MSGTAFIWRKVMVLCRFQLIADLKILVQLLTSLKNDSFEPSNYSNNSVLGQVSGLT